MRTYEQALFAAKGQVVLPTPPPGIRNCGHNDWYRLCQAFARTCVGAAPFGLTAKIAFQSIPSQYRHYGPPLPGSIAYYSGTGTWHAVYVEQGGYVFSTDILRHGRIDRVHYTHITKAWGLPYEGYITWTPSGPLPIKYPLPAAPPEDPDMPLSQDDVNKIVAGLLAPANLTKIAGAVWAFSVSGDEDSPSTTDQVSAARALSRSYSQSRKARIIAGQTNKPKAFPPVNVSSEDKGLYL